MKLYRYTPLLCLLLALALCLAGCGSQKNDEPSSSSTPPSQEVATPSEGEGVKILGEGETTFFLTVRDADGGEAQFEISTDEETVGAALIALSIIEGEQGDFGLYIKTVNGITVDYETDGCYWAFFVGNDYAALGVDSTIAEDGVSYTLAVES